MHFTVWMNNSEQKTVLSHPIETSDWKDVLSQEDGRPDDGMMNIKLDPLGYRILYRSIN